MTEFTAFDVTDKKHQEIIKKYIKSHHIDITFIELDYTKMEVTNGIEVGFYLDTGNSKPYNDIISKFYNNDVLFFQIINLAHIKLGYRHEEVMVYLLLEKDSMRPNFFFFQDELRKNEDDAYIGIDKSIRGFLNNGASLLKSLQLSYEFLSL